MRQVRLNHKTPINWVNLGWGLILFTIFVILPVFCQAVSCHFLIQQMQLLNKRMGGSGMFKIVHKNFWKHIGLMNFKVQVLIDSQVPILPY